MFFKKAVPRNFAIFKGKHLCQRPFLTKLQAEADAEDCNFIKKEYLARVSKLQNSWQIHVLNNNVPFLFHILWTTEIKFCPSNNKLTLYCVADENSIIKIAYTGCSLYPHRIITFCGSSHRECSIKMLYLENLQ